MIKLAPCSCRLSLMAFVTIAQLALSGCGWQLAGTMPLSPQLSVVYLNDNLDHDLASALRQQLNARGALVVNSASNALTQFKQLQFDIDHRTLTVDSDGKVAEYELQAVARLSVMRSGYTDPLEVLAKARLRLTNDTVHVLATQSDETRQKQHLMQELARQLLNQITSLTGKSG